jgi:hypothetical protein
MNEKKSHQSRAGWVGRVDDPMELEQTAWERLSDGPKTGYYSAFHTRGRLFTWVLLGIVFAFMGGIVLLIFVLD